MSQSGPAPEQHSWPRALALACCLAFAGPVAPLARAEAADLNSAEVTGPGPSGFSEIQVEDQADYATGENQLCAEIGSGDELSAVMSCNRPGAVPNPGCALHEQVGLFAVKASFNRAELSRLDLIRERLAGFVTCLSADQAAWVRQRPEAYRPEDGTERNG